MTDYDLAVMKLARIEMKYKTYFEGEKLSIMDCVTVVDEDLVDVQVTKEDLPPDIRNKIEIMFWR